MNLVVISGHDLRALSRDMPEVIDKMRSVCYDRVSGGRGVGRAAPFSAVATTVGYMPRAP